jgi:Uncharacterized conserved protein related to MYG1 family
MTKIVTHNGHYHPDDVFAVATLMLIHSDAIVVRSRDQKVLDEADMVVDVGQEYDPSRFRFDHHQLGGAGKRDNGIPYASFGLVWKEFGVGLAGGKDEADIIEQKLVMAIDAHDNGVDVSQLNFKDVREYNIGDFLVSFVTNGESMEELDVIFSKVVIIARDLLAREIIKAKKRAREWLEVKKLYEESENKKIVVLPKYLSWKRVLVPTEAEFVVFMRIDGKWQVRSIPKEIGGFELKKPLPFDWAGLNTEDLAKISGVKDAFFCHKDQFLVVALSKEGALELANKALNA